MTRGADEGQSPVLGLQGLPPAAMVWVLPDNRLRRSPWARRRESGDGGQVRGVGRGAGVHIHRYAGLLGRMTPMAAAAVAATSAATVRRGRTSPLQSDHPCELRSRGRSEH